MKRQAAFSNEGYFYKGNLHTHSSRVDGALSPEEWVRHYAARGYHFLAITDHNLYNRLSYALETNLTILPGVEVDTNLQKDFVPDLPKDEGNRAFHNVFLGRDVPENGYEDGKRFDFLADGTQEAFQKHIDDAVANHHLAIYCHPQYSCTYTRYFDRLQGYFAVELYNNVSAMYADMDTDNGNLWDELLGMGRIIYGVAVDDAHGIPHSFGGWVMVKAESNCAENLLKALENGAFYASCGPIIRDFYVEDDVAHVVAENVAEVCFRYDRWPSKRIVVQQDEEVSHISFKLRDFRYIRAVVTDKQGRKAWTNPIFLKEDMFHRF